MFDTYWPEHFCRDYVELRGHSAQLVNFMAVVLGHKPLMDDWVHTSQLEALRSLCTRYGLHVRAESVFVGIAKERVPAEVVGRESITSTSGYGLPLESGAAGGVHVFISRDESLLRHGMWYPVIVRNRVLWPPRADLLAYGSYLGYPPCCIRFFQKYNNWSSYSFLYEIYRRSRQLHAWCNPLGKDRTYSYIYHMPCTFDCAATIERVGALRSAIAAREPDLVHAIDRHLEIPALVLRERKLYFFEPIPDDGSIPRAPAAQPSVPGEQTLTYAGFFYEGSDAEGDVCSPALSRSARVTVRGQEVLFTQRDGTTTQHLCDASSFAPERPFLARFTSAAAIAAGG
jgi:hypothetical protein